MSEQTSPLFIDESACNGCGKCVNACMMNVIELRERTDGVKGKVVTVVRPEDCMFCEACVIGCRRIAILLNPMAGSSMIRSINEEIIQPEKKKFKFRK